MTCQKKIVVTVAIGGGQDLGTEQLNFQLSCVGRCGKCGRMDGGCYSPRGARVAHVSP